MTAVKQIVPAHQLGSVLLRFLDDKLPALNRALTIETAKDLFGTMTPLVPVDTGHARSSLHANPGAAPQFHDPGKGRSSYPVPTPADAEAHLRALKPGEKAWATYGARHVQYLERGWSPQAPNGWIEKTFRGLPGRSGIITRAALRRIVGLGR